MTLQDCGNFNILTHAQAVHWLKQKFSFVLYFMLSHARAELAPLSLVAQQRALLLQFCSWSWFEGLEL